MKLNKKFCVYVDKTDCGHRFYVGKGKQRRLWKKSRGCAPNENQKSKHNHISDKYGCNREVVFETDDENEAFQKEIELIALYQLNAYKYPETELACNFTDGGGAPSGRKWSEEERKARKEKGYDHLKKYDDELFLKIKEDRKTMTFDELSEKYKISSANLQRRLSKIMSEEEITSMNKTRYNDEIFTPIIEDRKTMTLEELSTKYSLSVDVLRDRLPKLMSKEEYNATDKSTKYDDSVFVAMIEDRKTMSCYELEKKYNIPQKVIHKRLSRLMSKEAWDQANQQKTKRLKYTKELFAKILEDRKIMTITKISEKYNIDPKTIGTWLTKYKQ